MSDTADVVVIGGGINGVAAAYNLARRGAGRVIVLEKDYLAAGSTGRCGAGVRQQWGAEMNIRLAKASIEIFESLDEELDYAPGIEFKQNGYLLVAYTEKQVEQFRKNVRLQQAVGVPSRFISAADAKKLVPHLNTVGLLGAAFCPKDGHINPFKATDAYARAAKRLGVDIRLRTEVRGIKTQDGRVKAVLTSGGRIETPVVVNTAGPWSNEVAAMAGVSIPTYSQRHQILVTEPVNALQGPMVMSFHHSLYCQQTPHGSFVMGMGDPHEPIGHDVGHSWQFLEAMAARICEMLPLLRELRVVRQWSGSYNMSPDAHPIIGEAPGLKGFFMAVGFSGHGFMLAPVTGRILSQLITGMTSELPVAALGLERFARGELNVEPSVV
jgi:sarcosine oxidase, subunit beta